MRYTLIIPNDWAPAEAAAAVHGNPGESVRHAKGEPRVFPPNDYSAFTERDLTTGAVCPALPRLESLTTRPHAWMPTLLKIMKRCDIDPALHAKILHITADDWQSCQRGELKVTSIDTVVCGCLLMEIFYFAFCFIGDWDMVSQWLNQVRCLPIFDNRCPLQTIKSGDIRDLADLQRVISGQVLSSPYL